MFRSDDVQWALRCSLSQPTHSDLHINVTDGKTYNILDLTIFSFLWQLCTQLCIIARMERIPFTVFTKTCFSLLGSFSSSSTPWKMRPKVPVKDIPQVFIWGKGQERHSQRHHIQRSKCRLTHRLPCLADLWTEMDRLLLKMLCLLMGLDSFGSCFTDNSQSKRFSAAQRTFHHLERFRNTYNVERQSKHVHHLLCLNSHPIAPGLYWGKMPFKKINHQHKLRKKSEPSG